MTTEGVIPPTSTPGIPVPFRKNRAVADGDAEYEKVQNAVDAATGSVIIGSGTYNENLTITTDDLTLIGTGQDSLIDGGTGDAITIDGATGVTIVRVGAQTTAGGGNAADAVKSVNGPTRLDLQDIEVVDADQHGINLPSVKRSKVVTCRVQAADNKAFVTGSGSEFTTLDGCTALSGVGGRGFDIDGRHHRLDDWTAEQVGSDGVRATANDSSVLGGRAFKCGNHGVDMRGTQQIIDDVITTDNSGTNLRTTDASSLTSGETISGTSQVLIVDDFESGSLTDAWSTSSDADMDIVSSQAFNGSRAAHANDADFETWTSQDGDGLENYVSKGDTFNAYTRCDTLGMYVGIGWGIADESNGYYCVTQFGQGNLKLWEEDGGSFSVLAEDTNVSYSTDTWYEINVVWDDGNQGGADNDMDVTLTDKSDDSQVTTLSANDSTNASETGVALITNNTGTGENAWIDYYHISS